MAAAAAGPLGVLLLVDMSIARNINDKKAEKSKSRRVGRCFGLIEMVPVTGSMTICCMLDAGLDTMMPREEPGAAM